MDEHTQWLELASNPGRMIRPVRVVFTREAINVMGEIPFLDLHDVALLPVQWDVNFDALVFALLEDSWVWLLLKHPELAELRWVPDQKP